jgi:hypothetical protein
MVPIPLPQRVSVLFDNLSECTWPGLGVRGEGLVGLTYRWIAPSGAPDPQGSVSRFIRDIPPGSSNDEPLMVTPPVGEFGDWTLEVMLVQQGVAEPLATSRTMVALHPVRFRDRRLYSTSS